MILALLFTLHAFAGLEEKWTYKVDGIPRAAFFDAETASVWVLAERDGSTVLDQLDLKGNIRKKGAAKAEGKPGPLRAHFGQLYWVAGQKILRLTNGKQDQVQDVPTECGVVSDLTISREGKVLLGCSSGRVLAMEPGVKLPPAGKPVTGLFLLDTVLYILRGKNLDAFDLKGNPFPTKKLCRESCFGLERGSAGYWLSVTQNSVVEFSKPVRNLLRAHEVLGRIGYIYDREPKEDLLLVPFSEAKEIRAYKILP